MSFTVLSAVSALALFGGMLLAMELGRRLGASRLAKVDEQAKSKAGALEASVFGLMGLLVAFTFSGAAQRFDQRRQLIAEEANAVGTAWLRLDLTPEPARAELRQLFRDYLDERLALYRDVSDRDSLSRHAAGAQRLQQAIWDRAVAACAQTGGQPGGSVAPMLLLPALNQMFDVASMRLAVMRIHPPPVVFGLLYAMVLASSFLAGYGGAGMRQRSWLHVLLFNLVMAVTVYVIADLEYPRLGLVRVDEMDALLAQLRRGMD